MQTSALVTFVVAAMLVAATCAIGAALTRRSLPAIIVALVTTVTFALIVWIASRLEQGSNYAVSLLQSLLSRDKSTLSAAAFGIAAGLPWLLWLRRTPGDDKSAQSRAELAPAAFLSASAVGVAGLFVVLLARAEYDSPSFAGLLINESSHQNGFSVRRVATIRPSVAHPIALAVDEEENIFVTYHIYFIGKESGGVLQFNQNADGEFEQKTIASSALLGRPYGLAVRDGDIFVSRSGRAGWADDGEISHVNAGAVTRLRDLDSDGVYEFMDDVLVGLPGSRGPDPQHQNQGIAFLPDGRLLVTQGNPTDHAPATHPWEGTILALSPDFESVEVVAEGFRNPFGITVTEDGNIIATDNDSSSEAGDEVNWVVEGNHYGHPFDHNPAFPSEGFTKPIFRAPRTGNLVGVTHVPNDHPSEALRGALLVADHVRDRIWRIRLSEGPDGVEVVDAQPFFDVPSPLNVAVGPSGTIYVVTYGIYSTNGLYTITAD